MLFSCTLFVQVVKVRRAVIVKVADGKKIKISFKKSCQIALFSIIVFFVLIFNPEKTRLYEIGCKCLKALLTLRETSLKDPSYRQNKSFFL